MKILLVNDYGTASAGAEIMLLMLRDGLRARGHDVQTFASRATLFSTESFADYTCTGSTTRLQALSSAFNPTAYFALANALRDFRPDLVHVKMFLWQLSPAILPLLHRVPALYHAVTYKSICPSGTKVLPNGQPCRESAGKVCHSAGCLTNRTWPLMMLQQWGLHRGLQVFDAFLAPSDVVRRRLTAEGIAPIDVIQNGTVAREMRPPLPERPIVTFAGRLSPEKGVHTLLCAFRRLLRAAPDVRLWIAGDGPERASLMAATVRLGIGDSVEFMGALRRHDIETRFGSAWVQVVPSIWEEPFGLVALESMMRGTAVVASSNGAFREFVEDGVSGILTPPGDERALADALLRLVQDRRLAEQMGTSGHQRAMTHFTIDGYVEKIETYYSDVRARWSERA